MRIVKEHQERFNEILDTAQKLFQEKGYEKCTVNDILNEIGIAKGTFYHYFKSKEEVLDAINERIGRGILEGIQSIAEDGRLSPAEKLQQMFLAMRVSENVGAELMEEMHRPENALMHEKSLRLMVNLLAPVLAGVVAEGVAKKEFVCAYPEEYMRIFLASCLTLTDDGIFQTEPEQQQKTLEALITVLAKMLSLPEQLLLKQVEREKL